MTINRRQFVTSSAALAVLAAAAPAVAQKPSADRLPKPTPPGKHEVKALPFDAGKLAGMSKEMVQSHHANNYTTAVKNLNAVELELGGTTADTPGFTVASLRERELTYTNSIILHERYFANLGGDGKVSGGAAAALADSFGSAARWEAAFRAAAMGLGGGSGWVVLSLSYLTGDLRITGAANHTQALAFGAPLLVLDMFEHAYAIDYGAGHARYIDAFFRNVRWDEVERRLTRARTAARSLLA